MLRFACISKTIIFTNRYKRLEARALEHSLHHNSTLNLTVLGHQLSVQKFLNRIQTKI